MRSLEIAAAGITAPGISSAGGAQGHPDLVGQLLATFTRLAEVADLTVLSIHENQEVPPTELSVLLVALQRAAGEGLPPGVIAAGLPGTPSLAAQVESFAQRMFTVWPLGPLDRPAARHAIVEPAAERAVQWHDDAADHPIDEAGGSPFFLQHFGRLNLNYGHDHADRPG